VDEEEVAAPGICKENINGDSSDIDPATKWGVLIFALMASRSLCLNPANSMARTEEVMITPVTACLGGGDMALIIAAVVAIVGVGAALLYMRKKK